jgi:predicted regulator of Ras-like GTPase activity (Roadblock/LC7/MglB family)
VPSNDLVIQAEDLGEIEGELMRLRSQANARFVFLIDRAGQQIAAVGELKEIDATSLASLSAGNVAATEGLAQIIGETAFNCLFQEGDRENLHISLIGRRNILLLAFDERSSLGLVRLRVRQSSQNLLKMFEKMETRDATRRSASAGEDPLLAGITDDDIDSLFTD